MSYPEGFNARDYDYVNGEQYAPDAPVSERMTWPEGVIYFDYTVLPESRLNDLEVQVEVTGMLVPEMALDFEHVRSFESVEAAVDWVYSFDSFELTYQNAKEAIKNGE